MSTMYRQAKFRDIKEGKEVFPDHGFTCMSGNKGRKVRKNKKGEYYIRCARGTHYLFKDTIEGIQVRTNRKA